MKKVYYFLFAFVPTLIGYIYSIFIIKILSIPFLGSLIFYLLPFTVLLLWFWVGRKFVQTKTTAFCAILIGNSVGILSLLLYVWQFIILSDQQRIFFLAGLSQHFSSIVGLLTAKVAVFFEPQKGVVGLVIMTGIQVIGLIVMVLVFAAGFFYEKRKVR